MKNRLGTTGTTKCYIDKHSILGYNNPMLVVNLYGGPGCGKSTTAARVFSELKILGYEAELVTEYAKDMVWENRQCVFDNQIYLFAKQHHRIWRLKGKVEVAITDSPLLLSLIYNAKKDELGKSLDGLVINAYKSFDNADFFLNRRDNSYNPNGRHQTEDEAKGIDGDIELILKKKEIPFLYVPGVEDAPHRIVEVISRILNSRRDKENEEN